ncbi:MAG TPA: hypothetical protein VNK44_06590 [Candidatus Nitrosotenuis sp.]|nr:hypothetical protein [Candidatus Nitrosotenuis sp.]
MSIETSVFLKQSFFASRVIDTITSDGRLDRSKRELFQRVLEYLETVKNGESELKGGSLVESPFKSIREYKNAFKIMMGIECSEEKNEEFLNVLLENIRKEIQTSLNTRRIDPKKLQTTKEFFQEAYKLSMEESSRQLMKSQEHDNWKIHSLS